MRVDVTERFEAVAAEMLEHNRIYLACVSSDLVEKNGEWGTPIQLRFVKRDEPGLIDIEARDLKLVGMERL